MSPLFSNNKNVFLDLTADSNNTEFATSIEDAKLRADAELAKLHETVNSVKDLKPQCDKTDYILAASSGALCGIIDIFLVGKPTESPLGNLTDEWYNNRIVDFAKLCGYKGDKSSVKSVKKFLEDKFKVPYDQSVGGGSFKETIELTPKNHHFKSLGHNPTLLGLFFSILDQFANTSTFVSHGQLITLSNADSDFELEGHNVPSKLFCGFVNWFGHIISDVSGSSTSKGRGMGIPSPIWSWTNDVIAIKAKLGIKVSDTDISLNNLAQEIFKKGYDSRFQTTQTIPVFLNEILVRLIYAGRRLLKYFAETRKEERSFKKMWKECEPFSNPTVKRMLTVAHGTFCLIDVGDATVRGFVAGGGTFNAVEFVMRLNIVGVGRFAVSLYGETKRAFSYYISQKNADIAERKIDIVENYIEGLNVLSAKYNDANLNSFVCDFKKSDAYRVYVESFEKSVKLAKLRNVPEERILEDKRDISRYFTKGKK